MAGRMRIGGILEPTSAGSNYRSQIPLMALADRGHEVVLPAPDGTLTPEQAFSCDVVHVYRVMNEPTQELVGELAARRIGVVWDNDDDFLHGPVNAYDHFVDWPDIFRSSVRIAGRAHVVTVTTPRIKELYDKVGLPDVRVVENQIHKKLRRPRPRRHAGVVVGWVAGNEHANDAKVLRLAEVLQQLQRDRPEVHVECIGVDLRLPERYRHDRLVNFDQLPTRMASWDIGLAAIADNPFNLSRSDIKVKEYAACRLPWLASNRGPYASLGEQQGGRLVDDDGWYDALDALVSDAGARKRLGKAGKSWAKAHDSKHGVSTYEAIFADAIRRAQEEPPPAPPRLPRVSRRSPAGKARAGTRRA